MEEEVQLYLDETREGMQKALDHLEYELVRVRAGKANPTVFDGIKVDYYGVMTPLNQVSNINTPDPKTFLIQPWDKSMLDVIEKAILAANLGFTPFNNKEVIRINVPPLTEERRIQLVKQIKHEAETARVSIRNTRKWANDEFKRMRKEGLPEDMEKDAIEKVQELTDDFIKKVDEVALKKEKEIMTV